MAQIRARNARGPQGQRGGPRSSQRVHWLEEHWRPVLILLLAIVILSAIALPRESWADFPIARFVDFDAGRQNEDTTPSILAPAQGPPGTGVPELVGTPRDPESAESIAPDQLPGRFQLRDEGSNLNGSTSLSYARLDGLELRIVFMPTQISTISVDREMYRQTSVNGVDVLYLVPVTPGNESVTRMVWVHQGMLFDLLVPATTGNGELDRETALQIVAALTMPPD